MQRDALAAICTTAAIDSGHPTKQKKKSSATENKQRKKKKTHYARPAVVADTIPTKQASKNRKENFSSTPS